ncbi:MAG: shikimate dehydrogenase [Chloroflexota bacterium]|nr:shikimate dehydrogenase [Chloroflexota bacterium]
MTDMITGVIGFPIDHSLSPVMHNAAFAALGLTEWRYEKMLTPPDVLRHSLKELRNHGVVGVNVTIPHKRAVMPFVRADAIARAIGAVNTIDLRDNSATNSDAAGFMGDLQAHGVDPRGMRVAVLGAGGAARAAVYGLVEAGAWVSVVNRTPENAIELIANLGFTDSVTAAGLDAVETADLIVNATSVGMMPRSDESPLPDDAPVRTGVVCYDMVYRPARTRLMAQIEAGGGRAIGGLGMLVRQGAVGFTLWTGQPAPIAVMLDAAKSALGD